MRLSFGINRFQPRLWLAFLIVGMGYIPAANAQKGRAAPHASAPHVSAPHVSAQHYSAPRMPQAPRAPSMPKQMNSQPNYAAANRARSAAASHAATSKANRAANVSSNTASNSAVRASNNAARVAAARARAVSAQNQYYGRARRYGGYNYRPRYYASGRRYTGSTTSRADRMVISRLRSAHANLARLDHDYQGHRVQAMHHISMAIRQLSHRSMMSQGTGFSARMTGMQRNGNGNVNGNRNGNGMRLTQAQSDSRMRHSLLMVTGAGQMLSQQANATNASYVTSGANTGRYRAYGYIHMAANSLNTALRVR
jgi:hypothetical protein